MSFDNDKKVFLGKMDKSAIGGVDEGIKELVDKINSLEDYFTRSSCAGRIVLLQTDRSCKKDEAGWIFSKHSKVTFEEIKGSLSDVGNYEEVWLRGEPAILHVSCRTMDAANSLLKKMRQVGFKRSGVFSIDKIAIEMIGTERMDVPVVKNGEIIVSDDYLKEAIEFANVKLERTRSKLKKLIKEV